MIWILCLGVALFTLSHLWLSVYRAGGPDVVAATRTGAFKGKFALVAGAGMAVLIAGWWLSSPVGDRIVYVPPSWGVHANNALMLIAAFLFGAAQGKSRLRRVIRHPQLTAVALWGGAHLLANGELRSVILFGALAVWALASMALINRRGPWEKPEIQGWAGTIRNGAISLAIFVALLLLHPYVFGVSPLPV